MIKRFQPLAVGQTDVGILRKSNEDAFSLAPDKSLLVVADGMGGHASGEVASRMAVDAIRNYFNDAASGGKAPLIGTYDDDFTETTNRLASAVRLANMAIYEAARGNVQWRGMGTTVVCALLHNRKLSIAHVGDSRLYLIRAGDIEQLTDDHSVVAEQVKRELISREEADRSEIKNILTRAVGNEAEVEVDLNELNLLGGDILVLCTDGLTNMVRDEEILSVVLAGRDPAVASHRLVELANEGGGRDNITVVVAYILEESWISSLINYFTGHRR
ncbi:MAG: Stp1/IreP family PP2C-type Ser/Thr phosphatase [Syntrophales bacterium]